MKAEIKKYFFHLLIFALIGFYGCSITEANSNFALVVYLSKIRNITNNLTNSGTPSTPPNVLSLTPLNNSTNILVGTPATIGFDKPMDLKTLTIISADGPCTGNIQVSANNFVSCLGGTLSLSTDKLTVSIAFVNQPCVETTYTFQYKIGTGVKDTFGNALTKEYAATTTFQMQQAVLKVGVNGGSGVLALAVSCNTLYIAGSFTTVGSSTRNNIAAIDLIKGYETSTVTGTDNSVLTIAVSGSSIYIGGTFGNAGGQTRSNIAALDTTSGMATSWNPNAGSVVTSIAVYGNSVYAGGSFATIGG